MASSDTKTRIEKDTERYFKFERVGEIRGTRTPIYRCGNHDGGCKWQGRQMHARDHAYRCNHIVLTCTCCNMEILKGFYCDHLMLYCGNRMEGVNGRSFWRKEEENYENFSGKINYVDGTHCEDWENGEDMCPRSHLGCKWRGTANMLEKRHQYKCNYQPKACAACKGVVQKGELICHLQNDCCNKMRIAEGTFANGVYLFNDPSSSAKNIEEMIEVVKERFWFLEIGENITDQQAK